MSAEIDFPWNRVEHPTHRVLELPRKSWSELAIEDPEISAFRERLASRAEGILMVHRLPDHGKSRSWINHKIPDKKPENPKNPTFSIMTWNIERGYKVNEQIAHLKEADTPDMLCLQEADWHCMRTCKENIALKIAMELGYKYLTFTTAFVEVDHYDYEQHRQDFPMSQRHRQRLGRGAGVMGQAVLSKYPIVANGAIKLTTEAFDYGDPKSFFAQIAPIHGGRVAQKIRIRIGDREVVIYNTHLESICGPTGRLLQYDQIKHDAKNEATSAVIVGDFNTCGHGLAKRFSEESLYGIVSFFRQCFGGTLIGNDPILNAMKWRGTEAELWDYLEFDGSENSDGFFDPFDRQEPTLKFGPKTMPLFKGKLDWTLFRKGEFEVKNHRLGPYGLSDHRPLLVEAQLI